MLTTEERAATDSDNDGLPAMALIHSAREQFAVFFNELKQRFVEREDAIDQIALALLAKEHVLLTGPPGTAKSALAKSVLQNIVDRDSGSPSVFARQFTESTVQTDLIGPLDFKTLMESGRTEHFTDEGMLGAAHAFLDEVLDGRDMLLRATLNVLHERELKQGAKTTKGAIECAVMTTNRYLSEVMEQSRETLLAFVDRIAFVAFIPKGFGEPQNMVTVLRQQTGPNERRPLPKLTLQDVDLLQELVDFVRVPDHVNEQLVALLAHFESEVAAATRADPKFVPTRYLSTRTVVRTARILRAICVYDWILLGGKRALQVGRQDFERLRLTLLLAGPAQEQVSGLLQREADARERRQLNIYQTEREIFSRALAALPEDPEAAPVPPLSLPSLAELRAQSIEEQLSSCEQLLVAAQQGGFTALRARQRLAEATDILTHHVLSRALRAGIDEHEREFAVGNLERLATRMDKGHPKAQALAPLLRTRALEVLESQLLVSLTTTTDAIRELSSGNWQPEASLKHAQERLHHIESKWRLKAALIGGGAHPGPSSEQSWQQAIAQLEDELVQLWELGFDATLARALKKRGKKVERLDRLLTAIEGPLKEMRECGRWFKPFGKDENCIAARVVGVKLMPYIKRALSAKTYDNREQVAEGVERLLQRLDDAGAHWAVSAGALIEWAARALLEAERHLEGVASHELSYQGYRALRSEQPSCALAYSLVEVCTHISLAAPELRQQRAPSVELLRDQLLTLDEALVEDIISEDERRLRQTLSFLRRWWAELATDQRPAAEQLTAVVETRFHALLNEESVLLRFALEAQLLADLFPPASRRATALKEELEEFNRQVQQYVHSLMHGDSVQRSQLAAASEPDV